MQRDQAHRTNELLERIAIALEKNNANVLLDGELKNTKDIPGFEGVLNDLDNLYQPTSSKDEEYGDNVHNDYLTDLVKEMFPNGVAEALKNSTEQVNAKNVKIETEGLAKELGEAN